LNEKKLADVMGQTVQELKKAKMERGEILEDYCHDLRLTMEDKLEIKVPKPIYSKPFLSPDDIRYLEKIAEANGIDTKEIWKKYESDWENILFSNLPEEVKEKMTD
jgi:hypothetical protein